MSDKIKNKSEKFLSLPLFAFVGGLLNGFIGAGGGVVMMLALIYFKRRAEKRGKNTEFAGTAAAVMVFSIVSATVYALTGRVDWSLIPPMLPAAVIGGAIGGALLKKINPTFLRLLFSFLVIYSGVSMLK